MGLLRRFDVIVLALMLARVIVIVGRAAYRYQSIRRSPATDTNSQEFQRGRKMFAADLSLRLYTLRSIAETAAFLGLAGSCVGIFDSFGNWNAKRDCAGNLTFESRQGANYNGRCAPGDYSSNMVLQLSPNAFGVAST
jgi:hypothetical protein